MKTRGFTFLELVLVIAIAGILIATAMPVFFGKNKGEPSSAPVQQVESASLRCVDGMVKRADGSAVKDMDNQIVKC
jgi:prepilin-type N-terminal cleavage/methylation domain-containing protein